MRDIVFPSNVTGFALGCIGNIRAGWLFKKERVFLIEWRKTRKNAMNPF
jgi:hypothetical protein